MKESYIQRVGASITSTQLRTCCNCIGPQRGEPVCPCEMANVFVRDGRWIKREVDLGPVSGYNPKPPPEFTEFPGEKIE